MTGTAHEKVTTSHLKRNAYLYIGSPLCARCLRTPRARYDNMIFANVP